MQTFEEYLKEKELNESLKDFAKKIKKIMTDFHNAKNMDTALDDLKSAVSWAMQLDIPKDKKSALGRFVKGLDSADLTTHKGRAKLAKLEKDFKPLLKSLNVGIKI